MRLEWDFHELYDFGDRLKNSDKFTEFAKVAVKQLAKDLHEMLFNQTPVKTGQLAAGWGGAENYSYVIKELKSGYKIEFINRVPYAKYVNDGHYSYNQWNKGSGRPYVVKHRTPKIHTVDGANRDATFVFGHFFVEKSVLLLENDESLNAIIAKELDKWFRWCVNGK